MLVLVFSIFYVFSNNFKARKNWTRSNRDASSSSE